jgi:CHASE3 domain sensor protein
MIMTAAVAPLSLFWIDETRAHRHVVEQQISSLRIVQELIVDAETGQRGFIIAGNEVFLQPYYVAISSLPTELRRLKIAYAGDPPNEIKKADDLISQTQIKLENLAETIKLRKEHGYKAVESIIATGHGKILMDQIRAMTADLLVGEEREVAVLDNELRSKGVAAVGFSVASTFLTMLLLSFMFKSMRRAILAQQTSASESMQFSKKLEESVHGLSQRWRFRFWVK